MKKALIITLVLCLFLCGCGSGSDVKITCIIECSDIINNGLQIIDGVPETGIIAESEITVSQKDGALDILKTVCKENDIQYDISDGYAKGIAYIYEKDYGKMSGWVYEVNDQMIMDEYTHKEGDKITWKYICDFSNLDK